MQLIAKLKIHFGLEEIQKIFQTIDTLNWNYDLAISQDGQFLNVYKKGNE